ncbi:hypothetical protein KFK09_009565 [Dendrobium nobile]|uniref:Uncharacterized protein n=1 Tax=Dendrobium nobile TaxID=94219 RepID=A0A8T3BHT4_DENNO|nr:hypothetical protein KFK09_009565 [Dendrobium nobile]
MGQSFKVLLLLELPRVQNPIQVDLVARKEKKNSISTKEPKEVRVDQASTTLREEERNLGYHKFKLYHLALKADGGGMDDGPDQDPMVPSSRAIMDPGLLSQRRFDFPPPGGTYKLPRFAVRAAPGSHPTTANKGVHGAVLRFATNIESRFR